MKVCRRSGELETWVGLTAAVEALEERGDRRALGFPARREDISMGGGGTKAGSNEKEEMEGRGAVGSGDPLKECFASNESRFVL